ncbi:MAG: RluA family pseudouridine synthase [Anaeromicrobium sp.]|jgi:23S rRNA pseudouridine955/2504/2580 synthase|uniref:RluA family pseudouridine synthase n=1 Tax=Anaeromicrobium sp. TaxID=1929132 RepID=UPI0025EDC8D1|nr:RluA family pseudouridine synthase [Anaeromicrobium sp.]MCT4592999.1 RluA family pseudouridine synthase [Anaeromicrobium sp.]
MREIVIKENEEGQRVDRFLKKYLNKSSLSFLYKMIRKKNIKVNNKRVEKNYILSKDDKIQLYLSEDTIEKFMEKKEIFHLKRDFKIVYEDDNILIVSKPDNLLIHEDKSESKNTLVNQVLSYLHEKGDYNPDSEKTFVPACVNRLDRNTSGLVIIAKKYESLKNLNVMMRNKDSIEKYYITIVKGSIVGKKELKGYLVKNERNNKTTFTNKKVNGAKEIHTKYSVIRTNKNYSLVQVKLITGRSHQIRLHLSSNNTPIIGDRKYGDKKINEEFNKKYKLKNQFLHAYKIGVTHTVGSLKYLEGKEFIGELPSKLKKIEKSLF